MQEKYVKKGILILSSSAVLLTTFVGFEGNKTSAATNEPTTVLPTENDYDALNNEKKELVLDYNSFAKNYQLDRPGSITVTDPVRPGGVQTNSVPSYAVKKALKWAINNTTTITNFVGKTLGKDAAVKVGNLMHTYVKPALRKLESVEILTYGKIEDAVYQALKKPLGKTTARIVASVIREAIEFLAPV
ncbi:hypothetical protein [Aeribacillus pallidus]|uniref:Uncharacterized protein n=1 Tax=Aeribacillus pallidus TaxID=33936 RepID=A0A223E2Z7_9BACI|nr:hypothetical protein [Aeribacillus pallidus]ASS89560.1 hypothetical protein AP3564_04190 [Aeribacillus pallidus]